MELERRRGLRSGVRGEEGVEGREREKSKAKFGALARSSPLYSCSLSLVFPVLGRHAYGMLMRDHGSLLSNTLDLRSLRVKVTCVLFECSISLHPLPGG